MTLRLVLISLVAGLGLGLPSWPTIEGWVAGAQQWMNARLAAADDREGERHVVIHDLLAAEMERAHAARQARRASASTPAPRPAIVAVPHSTAPRRPAAAASLAAPTPPIPLPKLDDFLAAAANVPAPAPAAPAPAVARPDDLALLAWGRIRPEAARLAASLAEGLREAAGRDRDARAFVAMEVSDDLYFEAVDEGPEPAPLPAEAVAAVDGPEPLAIEGPAPEALAADPAPLPDFDAMERSADLYFAAPIVEESAPAPEAMLAETPEPAAVEEALGLAELPVDVFAPDEAESVVAAPEPAPVAPVVAAVTAPEPAPASPEVNRAVRLTGEALSAWINVLTGPALVTAAHGVAIAR